MALYACFKQILSAAFSCQHGRAQVVEGKTFCPDCGQGVIFRWAVLRCDGCGLRRPARYRFREVCPAESCCTACGEKACHTQYLSDPEYFQLHYALLSFETDSMHVSNTPWLWETCKIWVERVVQVSEETCSQVTRPMLALSSSAGMS